MSYYYGLPFNVESARLHDIKVNDDFSFEFTYNVVADKGACYQVIYHNVRFFDDNVINNLPMCHEDTAQYYSGLFTTLKQPGYYFDTNNGVSRSLDTVCLKQPDPIEVTMKDLERKYGRPVKIVGEEKDDV